MTDDPAVIAAKGPVVVPRDVFDFLMGIGPLEGVHFGDMKDGLPGRFWWRAVLRQCERDSAQLLKDRP